MIKDILENTGIDIAHELIMGRIFCENMFAADYFYHTYVQYNNHVGLRDLL